MTLQHLQREKIVAALMEHRKQYDSSQSDFCRKMGIHTAAFSQLKKALTNNQRLDRIISDRQMVRIGRMLQVAFRNETPWNIVRSETYEYITAQLEHCQGKSIGRIFCDISDIGKTAAAKEYMLDHQNVFYVDCGQCKDKGEFMRALGKVVGVDAEGSLKDVYRDTIYMVQAMDRPLVILDEWGDLNYSAFLQTKAYWNALEGACGWYMMGADGLRKKIEAGIRRKTVGFTEMYRRLGGEFMNITGGMDEVQKIAFRKRQVLGVAEHNLPEGMDLKEITKNTLSLTRVKENIIKALDAQGSSEQSEAA